MIPPNIQRFAQWCKPLDPLASARRNADDQCFGARAGNSEDAALKKLAIVALGTVACLGTLSTAKAADVVYPVVVAPAPVLAPVVVAPHHHPLLAPVLWCAGGVIISVAVENAAPAVIGCTIGLVKAVHRHGYRAAYY
jgi:hypothetical protein